MLSLNQNTFFLFQAGEFFLFAALMIMDMIIFGFMAYNYTYVDPNAISDNNEDAIVERSHVKNKDMELIEKNVLNNVGNDERRI